MTTWLLVLLGVLLAAVVAAITMPRCDHVDEDGQSLLTWERVPGRVFGRCSRCGRSTTGWSVSWEATYRSPLKAAPASDLDIKRLRLRRFWLLKNRRTA